MKEQENKTSPALRTALEKELQLPVPEILPKEDVFRLVASRIDYLLHNDFHRLISLLYRLDVSETKLRTLLAEQPGTDAAELITGLLLERLMLSIKTRQAYGSRQADPSDPEQW